MNSEFSARTAGVPPADVQASRLHDVAARRRHGSRRDGGGPLWLFLLLLTACTVGPNYQKPVVSVPDQFYGAPATAESFADTPWFDVFGDPALRSLIEEALRKGYDVRIAAARVEEARARYGIAGAARYPDVDYSVRTGYGRQGGETAPRSPRTSAPRGKSISGAASAA